MSYQVLARKWRPRDFSQMVGQAHVVRSLSNALDHDRLHHAFLFAGTRGVGKTTLARILAKCLNCEQGVSSTPCGTCGACTGIDEGRFLDLLEVDAASRSKVDETRELMENVQFAAVHGRYKVYLIDEVHMFSDKSFNALLKTLEEPPPHVKFLLATTDPQKLPVTVLSRCLQFNLKRLPAREIVAHLEAILAHEGIASEEAGVRLIARAADGSMRDALSLLDQAIAYGGGRLAHEEVRAMLGTLERRHLHALLESLAAGDPPAVLARVEEMTSDSVDFDEALVELLSALQRVATLQVVPDAGSPEDEDDGGFRELAARMDREDVQLFYQIALLGRRDLPLSPDPRAGFEMTLLRMLAFRPVSAEAEEAKTSPAPPARGGAPSASPPAREAAPSASPPARGVAPSASLPAREAAPSASPPARETAPPASPPAREAAPSASPPAREAAPPASPPGAAGKPASESLAGITPERWGTVVEELALSGLALELARHSEPAGGKGSTLRLRLSPGHEQLTAARVRAQLAEALGKRFGDPVTLDFEIGDPQADTPARAAQRHEDERRRAAVAAIESDAAVRAICDTFGTRVDPGQVHPVD